MLPKPVENLIKQLSRLPGIGPKFAERLVFFLAADPKEYIAALSAALSDFNKKIKPCSECGNISEQNICPICQDPRRDRTKICVIESASDIFAIEKTGQYKGLYHILGGVISPHRDLMPENLRINQLIKRISLPAGQAGGAKGKNASEKIEEVIIATNPNTEGDATALYLAKILASLPASPSDSDRPSQDGSLCGKLWRSGLAEHKIKITRLARGLPTGGELEYMDETTLTNALTGRKKI
ncbi:recombination mediator RecR [Patescibacteria group bacterium]|nr:recombination mediator RecR [Patescibacteria group bacterium]MBU4056485.1 recombination mediator RecR [Patescibacteria group bacterium]MBU4368712.1 recombination mediator RecR [Patescibacteria group bacterium]